MKRWFFLIMALAWACGAQAADPPKEAEQGEGVSLTIYNQDFAVVKERRAMDLKQGRSTVRFRDVAATIVPESVQFSALLRPESAHVVEQNYEFDLVSADKLLDKYIDRELAVVTQDGQMIKGTLLSFDPNQLVLKTAEGIDLLPRDRNVKDVQFSALPGGLLTRPTLVWQIDADKGGKEIVKVAYRANQMVWRVDYRARLNADRDKLDLGGWVTVTNKSGTGFKDAQVKLMAGDVHVVEEKPIRGPVFGAGAMGRAKMAGAIITEKSFAEYHLYELGRKTTIKDRETKQVELLDVEAIPVTRHYSYRGEGNKVAVLVEFKNNEKVARGLGIPLPKGPMRIFQPDSDKQLEYAGTDNIDHTPKDEQVRIRLGYAFDLVGERRILATRGGINQSEQDVEIRLRNHKTEAANVDVVETINGHTNWTMLQQNHPFNQRDVNTLEFPISLKPNSEAVVRYTIRYTW